MFTAIVKADTLPKLEGRKIYLRSPDLDDFSQWADLRAASRSFLEPWEPTWSKFELTRSAFRRRLQRYAIEKKDGKAFHFFMFDRLSNKLVGAINLNNVRRGVVQSCNMGYWTGEEFAGQGYMSDCVAAIIPFVFEDLALNRLEGAIIPGNDRSKKVLTKNNFTEEGLARDYLKINGHWRDHILFGMTRADYRGSFQQVLDKIRSQIGE
jgi:ribosomal-protein-alanine N-acetyltransferase